MIKTLLVLMIWIEGQDGDGHWQEHHVHLNAGVEVCERVLAKLLYAADNKVGVPVALNGDTFKIRYDPNLKGYCEVLPQESE